MTHKHEPRLSSTIWIVVADRSRARIFAAEEPGLTGFHEIEAFVHPEGTLHQRDTESDGPGRFCESHGPRHAVEPKTDFRHRTADEFARELIHRLEHARGQNEFGRFVLVAPPLLLGALRGSLTDPLAKSLFVDLDKDLTRSEDSAIEVEVRRRIQTVAGQP